MKQIQKLINEPFAKSAARFMMYICYILILISIIGLVLSFMGRQTFILYTETGMYDSAIYAEESHDWTSRGPTISLNNEIRVRADDGEIDLITQIGISTMYAIVSIPLIISFWFLSRMFYNISEGKIFIARNASYLLYYGFIKILMVILVPFIHLLISHLVNQFTNNEVSVASGQSFLNELIPNIAFIVAAYIIHYGVHLQDEADHTI